MSDKLKMNYYMLNDTQDLFDMFKNGLINHKELVGFCKGAMYKYSTRYDKKGQRNSDLDKLVTYAMAIRDLEYDHSKDNQSNDVDNASNVQDQQSNNNDIATQKEH